jgi:hypothetical protein
LSNLINSGSLYSTVRCIKKIGKEYKPTNASILLDLIFIKAIKIEILKIIKEMYPIIVTGTENCAKSIRA